MSSSCCPAPTQQPPYRCSAAAHQLRSSCLTVAQQLLFICKRLSQRLLDQHPATGVTPFPSAPAALAQSPGPRLPSASRDTTPLHAGPRAVRPTRLMYSEGSRGNSNRTTCSTWHVSKPSEVWSVVMSTTRVELDGGARNTRRLLRNVCLSIWEWAVRICERAG